MCPNPFQQNLNKLLLSSLFKWKVIFSYYEYPINHVLTKHYEKNLFLENYAGYYNIHFLNQTLYCIAWYTICIGQNLEQSILYKLLQQLSSLFNQVCSNEWSGPILLLSIQFRYFHDFLQKESTTHVMYLFWNTEWTGYSFILTLWFSLEVSLKMTV